MAGLDELLKARDKKRAQTQAMVRAAIEPVRIKRPEPPRKRSGTVNPGVTAEDFRQAGVSQVVDLPLVVKAVGESAGNALYGVGAGVSNTLRTRLAQTYNNQVKMGEMAELYFPGRGRAAAAQDLANQRELERQIKVSQQNLANRNGAWQEKYDVLPRPVKWTANAMGQTAQMLPAIGAGMMAGPLVGGAVLGAQVLGNSAGQALNEGASFDQAVKYGAAEAVKEMAIERMFGAIPGLGQGAVNFNGVLAGAPRAAQVVGRTALGAVGEGIEEGVAQVATPFLQRATYAPEAANATWPEILDAAGQGMVGGLLLGGAGNMYQARLAGRSERILEEQAARTERLRNQQTSTGSEALRPGGMRAEDGSFVSRPTPEQQVPTGFTGARGEAGQFASRPGEQQVTAPRLQLHIDQRDAQIIRDKSVNAFQYDHPQVQQYFQQQASVLLGDVRNGVRGQRVMQRDEEGNVIGVIGQGRANSEPIERMLNAGMDYGQIERGLKYIIEDNGKENRQSAKLVEMYLDEAMSNGYQSMDGDVGINYEYLDAKSHIAGAVPNALYRDAETLAGVQQEMQSPRVEEQGNITDADASNVEASIRRFIDRSTTKAGLRYRIVDGLDGRINAYIEGDTIVYNANRLENIEAVRQVTAHEVYHSLLGTDEHSRLMDMAVDYFGGGMLSVEQMIGAKKAEYKESGVTLDDHGALDEIGAEFMEIALADERVANRILTEQPNLAQRILGYIRERLADFKAMRGLSEAEKRQYSMLKTAQALYEQGLKAQGRQSASQRRYRIDPNFAQQIKRWVSGQMGANEYFDLGTTPQILQQFGAKPLPIVMAQKVIVKINGGKHNIAWEEIARLPDQIAHPLAILKGSTSNSFVVLTDIADKSGKRVIAAIHLDKMQNRLRVNRVASLYEKDNINNYVAKNINEGKLVYPEKEIASTWFTSEGLQLPKLVQTNVDADLSIAEDTPLSNGLFDNLTPEQRAKLLDNGENRRYKIDTAIPKKQQSADLGQRLSLVRSEGPKSRFEQLLEEYGAIPEGEMPRTVSDARTPQQTDPFNRVGRFTRTAMEAEAVDDDVRQGIRDDLSSDISSGRFVYVPINNKSTLNQANQRLATRGYEQAVNEFRGLYSSGKRLNASDMALGERLIIEASKRGDTETATQLIADVAALGTEMGQAVQALRLIKRMTPEGRLMMLERTVNRINGKLAEEHRPQVALNPRFAEEMLRQETVEGADQVQTDALLDIAEQMPSTLADKINAWRYLSMLGNPRTHIRNIVGNAVFTPVRAVRNILSFTGEQFLPAGVERTKSLLIKPGYRSFAEVDYEQAKATISAGGSKYDMFSKIERNKRIFRNPLVEKMRKWNENALEAEDMFFSRRAYVKALAGYMQANHLTPDYLQSGTKQSGADFQRAQNYAVREAQKATFRDYSGMASALNHFERKNAVTKVIGGAVMPFKKTPINILKRGVEYSPMGLAEGLTRGVYQAAKGKITPAELIDRITAGLTGSGIMALGYFLASLGLLSAGEDDPQKKAAYDRALGSQNYAVDFNTVNRVFNLNLPNGTYTIDWLAPSVMPLMTGVELYNSFNTEYGDDVAPVGQVVTQLTKVINPVLETSMMQGLLGVMQSFQSGSAGQLTDMVGSAASSYGGQFVPTLAGQVARTIDETKRSTYAPTNSPYTQGGERFGRQMMAKLPGASEHLEPQVDIWGREVKQPGGSIAGRAFNNMLNPGLYKPNMETAVDRKLLAMYDKTGESKVLPSGIGKAVEYGGKRYPLKAIEYTAMQKQVGSRRYADVRKLQGSVYTKELDESQMSNVIANLYEYRNKEAKAEYLRGKGVAYEDGAYWKAKEAEQSGISPVDYFAVKQIFGGEYEDAKKKYDACKQLELDFDVYQRVTRELSDIRSDKDRNGRAINGSRKEKVIAYLNQSGLTYEQKRYFLLKAYPSMAK